jgi:hypothetical protein
MFSPVNKIVVDNDDITIVTSNVSSGSTSSFSTAFSSVAQALPTRYDSKNGNAFSFPLPILTAAPAQQSKWVYAALTIASNETIADSGTTQIFFMDGTLVHNEQKTMCPLKVALADGRWVMSTHMCDIIIPGLPTTLIRHIVPELSIASLFGICVLTEAGCTMKFNNKKCVVRYKEKTILIGMKDPVTDLWTLLIVSPAGKTSRTNTTEEQDPFINLHEEFLETTSKASISNELVLAIPVCASAQVCMDGGKATKSLKKKPPSNQLDCSPTPSEPRQTASNSPINPCVARTCPHS